jgi:NAD(P)-dependent dehydrogenase (short-subunit alcohol dehydrogenase family)
MPYSELAGKVVVVTGATGGIGKPLVSAFVEQGLRVGAIDLDEARLAALQAEFGDRSVLALRCDVSDAAECEATVARVHGHFGGLHALINNAALGMQATHPDYEKGELQIEDVPPSLWAKFMAVNVNGPYFMASAAVPLMRAQRWGRIINVTTSYVTMMRKGFAPYGCTKAAIEAWTKILSRQLEGSGITANVVLPGGPVDTAMIVDYEGLDRSKLIPPGVMIAPILGLLTGAGDAVTGERYIAVEWDDTLGTDPAAQKHRSAAWPDLAQPFSSLPPKTA